MAFDFEQEFGVNAGYVQALFEDWRADPSAVDATWKEIFERVPSQDGADPRAPLPSSASSAEPARATSTATEAPPAPPRAAPAAPQAKAPAAKEEPAAKKPEDEDLVERLTGVAGRIVKNMTSSLDIPTATTVRTLSAKLLDENRRIINEHMQVRALGKTSYTHLIAWAIVKALKEIPRAQSAFFEEDGKPHKRVPAHVNIGLAIDIPNSDGSRSLVVPSVKSADTMNFSEFYAAYEDIVARGRDGKLTADDFRGTTMTLTNPGGFGTVMSVPRLMEGQGLIVATGSIGVPPEALGMSAARRAEMAIGQVMTITSTYDHRVVQGAESGLLCKRIDDLLQGADGFYDEIFRVLRIPWTPARAAMDMRATGERDAGEVEANLWRLISAYRTRGGMLADLDPLEYKPEYVPSLDPATYGFTIWDLDRHFLCDPLWGKRRMTLREILTVLRRAYCRRWTVEYMHIQNHERKQWIRGRIERPEAEIEFDLDDRRRILTNLERAEKFERFLHARYVGNKRFSLEGADTLIPALAELLDRAAEDGVEKVVFGMAHRGRLNVLANILGRSYERIFQDFEGVMLPLSSEGSGDVKYHVGQRGTYVTRHGKSVEVVLSANPSHLEAVDPIVCGMTRADQDAIGDTKRRRVLAVLIHGDAAFSGQGVVAETLNMSELAAYSNGGTIHIVVNNQIGFTASPKDLRSTTYCTDIAKGIQAPVVHANGDYPESVLRAVTVALDYQRRFGSDAVVDMVCYRRWGHNEGDEPAYTQPVLYAKIQDHPTPSENYTRLLIRRGALTREEADKIREEFESSLHKAVEAFQAVERAELPIEEILDLDEDEPEDYVEQPSVETGVPAERLVSTIDELNRMPEGHVAHPKLLRQLRRREQMVRGELDLDWGCAETLAFGTLVQDGSRIRLAGQDSGRGTFSHRHSVIRDQMTGKDYVPLADLGNGHFESWDSLLSEEAALGFEYGYALANPAALVLWEAQFGDFANGAQIQIDQFITSGEAKWKQVSGLVLLLPHGFDGQGPEHSSARPERFLALCSGGNMTVCNCSTAAQYFHLLRRHGATSQRRPLVIFTPKSLLRDKRAASPIGDFANGRFRELIDDSTVDAANVRRVVLCTGKVFHDLDAYRTEHEISDTALVRLEQLYPLPRRELLELLDRYAPEEVVWCQEEPRNMGFWSYLLQRFHDAGRKVRYCGRAESSSPATGS